MLGTMFVVDIIISARICLWWFLPMHLFWPDLPEPRKTNFPPLLHDSPSRIWIHPSLTLIIFHSFLYWSPPLFSSISNITRLFKLYIPLTILSMEMSPKNLSDNLGNLGMFNLCHSEYEMQVLWFVLILPLLDIKGMKWRECSFQDTRACLINLLHRPLPLTMLNGPSSFWWLWCPHKQDDESCLKESQRKRKSDFEDKAFHPLKDMFLYVCLLFSQVSCLIQCLVLRQF